MSTILRYMLINNAIEGGGKMDDVIARYNCDNEFLNSVNNNITATIGAPLYYCEGKENNAIDFTKGGNISFSKDIFNNMSEWCIEFWANILVSENYFPLSCGDYLETGGVFGIRSRYINSNSYPIYLKVNNVDYCTTPKAGVTNSWHHYALTFKDSILRLFYDGCLIVDNVPFDGILKNDLFFNRAVYGWVNKGILDNVTIYNKQHYYENFEPN